MQLNSIFLAALLGASCGSFLATLAYFRITRSMMSVIVNSTFEQGFMDGVSAFAEALSERIVKLESESKDEE